VNFNRFNFQYFYTIKPFWIDEGELAHQFLTRMLSARISSLGVCSARFEGVFKFDIFTLFMLSICISS
jgi:hypothetical protein